MNKWVIWGDIPPFKETTNQRINGWFLLIFVIQGFQEMNVRRGVTSFSERFPWVH